MFSGNVNELGDAGGSPGKSSLFSFTVGVTLESDYLEIGSMAGRALHLSQRPVRFQRPVKIQGNVLVSHPIVPISASGPQGDQPLVHRTM